jgi:hypothetical protein
VADGTLTEISTEQHVVRDPDPETTGIDFNLTSIRTEVSEEEKVHDSQYSIKSGLQMMIGTFQQLTRWWSVLVSLHEDHFERDEGHPEGNEHDPLADDSLQLCNGADPLNDDSLPLRNGNIVVVHTGVRVPCLKDSLPDSNRSQYERLGLSRVY